MVSTNLHLVDKDGAPLAQHIVEAVQHAEPKITGRFGRFCDPATLSNSLEEGARRIAQHEHDHGRHPNTPALAWRTLLNAAISAVRKYTREESFSHGTLVPLAGVSSLSSPESTFAGIEARETLAAMSERNRRICILEHQGFGAEEIAAFLDMNPNTVMKAKSRRLAKLAASAANK